LPPDAPGSAWRFLDDERLFTVLTSRARRRFVVYLSGEPPPGLFADYLAQADVPPSPPLPAGRTSPWAGTIVSHLRDAGIPVRQSYPVGCHVIDIVIGDKHRFAAVETDVHPDGIDAHVRRRLALHDMGWDVLGAYNSKWDEHVAELVIELAGLIGWPLTK